MTTVLCHPLDPNLPPTILQYVDNTLIIADVDGDAALQVKEIRDNFAIATGLTLNFHKTTFVPLNYDSTLALSIASTFGCSVFSFPQTYLGFPYPT